MVETLTWNDVLAKDQHFILGKWKNSLNFLFGLATGKVPYDFSKFYLSFSSSDTLRIFPDTNRTGSFISSEGRDRLPILTFVLDCWRIKPVLSSLLIQLILISG